jgi:Trypsin-like peptidase domain
MASVESSIVRIFSVEKKVVGFGFLATNNQILTCSHVVNMALKRPKINARPSETIEIDFPFIAPNSIIPVRVVRWQSVKEGDVATLEPDEDLPARVSAALLSPLNASFTGREVQIYGPSPSDPNTSIWVKGALSKKTQDGRIQIDPTSASGYSVISGFSGSPVWDEKTERVVGMIVSADTTPGVRTAFMIPSRVLGQRLVFEAQRGTLVHSLNYLRSQMLTALLDDLTYLEERGLDNDNQCADVRAALSSLANAASDTHEGSFWKEELVGAFEEFHNIYFEWNSHSKDGLGAPLRRISLAKLRTVRTKIANNARANQAIVHNELDSDTFASVYHNIGIMCNRNKEKFPRVNRKLKEYYKRIV